MYLFIYLFGLFNWRLCLAYHVCNDLALAAVNLRAICRLCFTYGSKSSMTLPSMGFLVFVDSDMNENYVREPIVHEMLYSTFLNAHSRVKQYIFGFN